jgi:hypothetical protein
MPKDVDMKIGELQIAQLIGFAIEYYALLDFLDSKKEKRAHIMKLLDSIQFQESKELKGD